MTDNIRILLVDDVPETRETIKKLIAFEPDFKVIGTAGNGREGVQLAKELKPDIVIMDINMPDMDGLEAASLITKAVPTIGVIMMSVQNDADYMRKAMLAGARNFLSKPVDMDELHATIRNVYQQYEPIRANLSRLGDITRAMEMEEKSRETQGGRPGHVVVVYSPKGGAGCTTVSTNLASAMMKEGLKVLLIDGDVQFGDVSTVLNVTGQTTLIDLVEQVDDLDVELFDSIVLTHDSGLKVVIGPPRPELAERVKANPSSVATVIEKIASYYDFIIVDTATPLDEMILPILDMAARIVLITTPTLTSVNSVRRVLDLFDQLGYPKEKTFLTINMAADDRNRKGATIPAETIQNYLKIPVRGLIPWVEERILLSAVNKGVPVIAIERDTTKPPVKQLLQMANNIYADLMGSPDAKENAESKEKQKSRLGFLGR